MPPSIAPFIPGSPGIAEGGEPMQLAGAAGSPAALPPEVAALLASLPPEQLAALVAQAQAGAADPGAAAPPGLAAPGPGPAVMPPEMAAAVEAMPPDAGGPPVDAGGPPVDAGGPPVDAGGPPAAEEEPEAKDDDEDDKPKSKSKAKAEKKDEGEKQAFMSRTAGAFMAQPAGLLQKHASTLEHADGLLARPAGSYMARR